MELNGADEFIELVNDKAKNELLKKIVKTNGEELQKKMVNNTKYFTGHTDSKGVFRKPTGATKKSITGVWNPMAISFIAGPGTHYSPYVNFGTRFMTKRPFVTDAFNAQKEIFKRDLERASK